MKNERPEYIPDETRVRMKFFQTSQDVFSKGKISLVIQFTRMVKDPIC